MSVYTAKEDFPADLDLSMLKPIEEILKTEWDIFEDIGNENILRVLKALAVSIVNEFPNLFNQPVGILEKYDVEYMKGHSILRVEKWEDFVKLIKHNNRFHSNAIDVNKLKEYCMNICETIVPSSKRYYRARIAPDAKGYSRKKLGAPPAENATDGRANSAGISRLYLSDKPVTTFYEVRAAEYDYVSVGTFKLLEPIKVVDLSQIARISPFGEDIDYTMLAINLETLRKINQEMAHPMRRGDSVLDYLPTQYICDYIMSIQDPDGTPMFDGIKYQSAMHKSGFNLTIFYPEKFECTYVKTYEVKEIKYNYS